MKRRISALFFFPLATVVLMSGYTASQYIDEVLSGRQVVCKWTRLAVERHIRDLERAGDPDFPYYFDEASAKRVIDFKYYTHDSGDERVDRLQTFETLLTNQADTLAFAEKVLLIVGVEYKPFDIKLKLQALEREVMDIIEVEIWRLKKKMLGWVRVEILGIHQDPEQAGMTLNCRIVEIIPETVYVQGSYYGVSYYGDTYYSRTENQEVA